MTEQLVITGAGSGKAGGSGGGLNEQEDTLKSTSFAQVLDLICEGEIGGLVDGLKSIYLDDTPIMNPDGSTNFTSVEYASVNGTQDQSTIAGFDQVRSETQVNVDVTQAMGGSYAITITDTNVTSVGVTVQMPGLTLLDDKGNLGGTSVNYAIDINVDGGGWVEKINDTVSGKSSSAYQRQYRVNLPAGSSRQVRLRRITPDSTSASTLNNKTVFLSYTAIIDAKLRYPNSALVALKVDASQFRSIPRRGYDVKLLKIKFPTNATVRADGSLLYSGTWDGTFQIGWCACPAWAYYDLVTTDRYGLGTYVDAAMVDKWALYTISKYCNELVSDGFGGTEPRFTCNIWVNTRQDVYKVLNDFTSIFRGMAYWGTGAVTTVQDAPKDPSYLFTNSNVIDGQFTYQGSSAKGRHTVALVQWNDPEDMYRQKIEYVEDTDGISRYGIIEAEVVAFGCTSRGQAHRLGRWLLYSERYETEIVGFKTGQEGVNVRPGNVIKVADQFRAGQRLGGRVVSATGDTVVVDSLDEIPTGTLTLYVMGADGTVQTRTVDTVSGTTITVADPFDVVPLNQFGWILSSDDVYAQTFRVLTVNEDDSGQHEITALVHEPLKFGLIEQGLTLPTRTFTTLSPIPELVSDISFSESLYFYQNDVRSKLSVFWTQAQSAVRYRIEWRFNGGNWNTDETSANDYEILDTIPAKYEVRIYSIGVFGTPSKTYASASKTTVGKKAKPQDVQNFNATIDPALGVFLSWDSVTDLDLNQYEIREGASWSSGTIVTRVKANSYKIGAISGEAKTYWIKAIDTSGIYSANAASDDVAFASPSAVSITQQVIDNNVLLRWTEATSTLAVDYYEIRKGSTWAAGSVVGRISKGTFAALFETASGSYRYWVAGVDIGGNVGTPASVVALVNQPPDYQLLRTADSTFSGTKVNAVVSDGDLFLGVDTTTTYQAHFTNNAWNTPQDQINAGYTYWVQPTTNTASYEEVIDHGVTIAACKVSMNVSLGTGFGNPTVAYTISVSNTSATGPWTNYTGVNEVYVTNFRWVKVKIDMTGTGTNDLVRVQSLVTTLDAKQKSDFGSVNCTTVAGGDVVNFNTTFASVSSITLSAQAQGTTVLIPIYDFAGGANPTSFKVLLYNSAGTRVTGSVSWAARGY